MYSYNPYYANYLMHYGTPKHSGRYPWGSGERPYQHGGGIKIKNKTNNKETLKESVLATYATWYGAMAVIGLASYGIKRLKGKIKDKKVSEILQQNAGEIDKTSGMAKKTVEYSEKEDLKMVNPGFGNGKKTTNNCSNCSVVYDLRKRGFEVSAGLRDKGRFTSEIAGLYKNPKVITVGKDSNKKIEFSSSYVKRFENEILKHGDNQRGIICCEWTRGGGHAFNYEVRNGKITYIDGQTNKIGKGLMTDSNPKSYMYNVRHNTTFFRTDNLTPNYKKIKSEGVIRNYDEQ